MALHVCQGLCVLQLRPAAEAGDGPLHGTARHGQPEAVVGQWWGRLQARHALMLQHQCWHQYQYQYHALMLQHQCWHTPAAMLQHAPVTAC
jgi:hypothetical protein